MEAEEDAILLCQDIKPGKSAEIICEGNKNNSSKNIFGVPPEDHRDDSGLPEDRKEMRDEIANVAEDEDGLTNFIKDARSCCQDIGEDVTKDGEVLEERKGSKGAEEEEVLTKSLESSRSFSEEAVEEGEDVTKDGELSEERKDSKGADGVEGLTKSLESSSSFSEEVVEEGEDVTKDGELFEERKDSKGAEEVEGLTKSLESSSSFSEDAVEECEAVTKDGELLEEKKDSKGAEEEDVLTKTLESSRSFSEEAVEEGEDGTKDGELLEERKDSKGAEGVEGLTKSLESSSSFSEEAVEEGEEVTKDGELFEERKDSKGAEEEQDLTKSLEQHSNYVCQEVGGDEDGGQATVKFEGKTYNYEEIEDVIGERSETEISEDQGQESVMEDGESADKGTDSEVDQESRSKEIDEDAPFNETDKSEHDEIAVDDTVQKKPNISSDAEQSAIIKGLQPLGQKDTEEGEGEGKKNEDAGSGITDQSLLQREVVGGEVGEGIVAEDVSDEPNAKIMADNGLLVQEEADSDDDRLLDETRGDSSLDEILNEKQVAAPTRHLSDSFTRSDERQIQDEPDNLIAGVVEQDMECSEDAEKDGAKCTRAEQGFREVGLLPESVDDVKHRSLSDDVVLTDIEVSDKRQQVQQTAIERTQVTDHHFEDAVIRNDTDLTQAERHVKDFEYQEDETIEVSPGSLQMTNLDEVRDLESIEGNESSGVIVQVGDPGMSDNRQVELDLNAGRGEDNVGATSLYNSDHGVSSSCRETTVTSTVLSIKSKTVLEGNSLKSLNVIETNVTIETRSEAIDS
ncbi:hypothetical protein BSL78_24099 [Apostichopus japonicus]|uniref:Uncharacterized protein n=1 Tax=Stichopus japonicus TaxID=307972 RepID=A0A2G8JTI7_STIJA|nr:hypothetical protein BSL78_24099 [Apostichopus japonicus]